MDTRRWKLCSAGDSNDIDMIHALLDLDHTTGILLGFLQALLVEDVRGILELDNRGRFPALGWVSSE